MERNFKFDILRFIGVLVIMLAHSYPPDWLFQLRNFGTPLLILGSALTYEYIYRFRPIHPLPFFKKRLIRLTFPTWAFLTFLFLFFWIATFILNKNYPFSSNTIITSYTYYDGIGFVWILKVYMILALITPFCLRISKSTIKNAKYFLLLSIIYLVYEIITYFFLKTSISESIKNIISEYILVVIPYSVLYFYGMRLHQLKDKTILLIIATSFVLFLVLAIQKFMVFDHFIPTQKYKYPPRLYYLSYAFCCINLMYYSISKFISITNDNAKRIITWLSSNSLWIYLWHIMAYYIWDFAFKDYTMQVESQFFVFCINTIFLLSFGIVMTQLQVYTINKLMSKNEGKYNKILVYFA